MLIYKHIPKAAASLNRFQRAKAGSSRGGKGAGSGLKRDAGACTQAATCDLGRARGGRGGVPGAGTLTRARALTDANRTSPARFQSCQDRASFDSGPPCLSREVPSTAMPSRLAPASLALGAPRIAAGCGRTACCASCGCSARAWAQRSRAPTPGLTTARCT